MRRTRGLMRSVLSDVTKFRDRGYSVFITISLVVVCLWALGIEVVEDLSTKESELNPFSNFPVGLFLSVLWGSVIIVFVHALRNLFRLGVCLTTHELVVHQVMRTRRVRREDVLNARIGRNYYRRITLSLKDGSELYFPLYSKYTRTRKIEMVVDAINAWSSGQPGEIADG